MNTKSHPKTVRTEVNIKKVNFVILKEIPLSQRSVALKLGMSSNNVSKIINRCLIDV